MQALRLKESGCYELNFEAHLEKGEFNLSQFTGRLAQLMPNVRGLKRLPIYFAVGPVNEVSDCHLHLSLCRAEDKNGLDLSLSLHPIKKHGPPISEHMSLEHISDWLGTAVQKPLRGTAVAYFSFQEPEYQPVIPLPRAGVVPIESSLIRKSSITGIELTVEESDIGLRKVFLSKPAADRTNVAAMFRFSHETNYGLLTKLVEYAEQIANLLVVKDKAK